jgi:hypothetical protein
MKKRREKEGKRKTTGRTTHKEGRVPSLPLLVSFSFPLTGSDAKTL